MTWFDWTMIGLWIVSGCSTILMIGKPRDPIAPAQALITVIVLTLMTVGLLWTRGAL